MSEFKIGEKVKLLNNYSCLRGAIVGNCYRIIDHKDGWYLLPISEGSCYTVLGKKEQGPGWWFMSSQLKRVIGRQLEFAFMYE